MVFLRIPRGTRKSPQLEALSLLNNVTQATLVAQLLYASPAWSAGFIKADEKAKLKSILNKTVRDGFLTNYKPLNICLNHQILLYFRLS